MDFRLTSEQTQFRDSVLRFAQKELAAGALARAHDAKYPWDVAKKMAQQGLLGITIAEADGGQGGTLIDAVLAIEAVASACPRSADVIQAGIDRDHAVRLDDEGIDLRLENGFVLQKT